MKIMVSFSLFFLVGCTSLTTLKPARVPTAGEVSGTMGISKVENDGPMMDGACRVGLGKGIDIGAKSDLTNFQFIDLRVQVFKDPIYSNVGLAVGLAPRFTFSALPKWLLYEPSISIGQDPWYCSLSAFYPTSTMDLNYLSRELTYIAGTFSAWSIALGGKIDVTKTSSLIAELSYVKFRSAGVVWVPAIGIQVTE